MSMEKRGENKWRFRKLKKGIAYVMNFEGTEREAKKAHKQFEVDVERGDILPYSPMTYDELFELFIKEHMIATKKSLTTIEAYRSDHRTNISSIIGGMDIADITLYHTQKVINSLMEKNLAESTILHHRMVMSSVFNRAIKWRLLKENPTLGIETPTVPHNNYIELMTLEQIIDLINAIDKCTNLKYKLAFAIALTCGPRESEILGLSTDDINFQTNILDIETQWGKDYDQEFNKFWALVPPKTKNSVRGIQMTAFVRDAARQRIAEMQNSKILPFTKMIFYSSRTGRPLTAQCLNYNLKKLLKDNNLPIISFHKLRHLQASLLEQMGTDKITMAHRLGDRIETIQRFYFNRVSNYDKLAAQNIDDFVESAKCKEKSAIENA